MTAGPGRPWAGLLLALVAANASAAPIDASPGALAQAMQGARVVVLGEVHDNAAQHRLRYEALRQIVAAGARPALAFEQFDRERQADIERARRERPRDAAYLIAQVKTGAWEWAFYQPFVQLALDYDLPIVAANLSRGDAMRVAREGYGAAFDAGVRARRQLEAVPEAFRRRHERSIAAGHCGLLPESALPAMARAQIARDVAMAEALLPYRDRGVVLLTGNGHARIDLGVPYWINAGGTKVAIGIGVLEADNGGPPANADAFDFYASTRAQDRGDPCKDLPAQLPAASKPAS
jgi:uncharacterized iron-regulated protein